MQKDLSKNKIKADCLFIILSVLILFMSNGCKKNPVSPPNITTCIYPEGNSNFTWSMDTVAWWPSTMGGIWTFSDSDAYIMGNMHGPTVPGQTSYIGLHWNGKQWGEPISFKQVMHMSNDVTGDNQFLVSVGYWGTGDNNGGSIDKAALAEFDNSTKKWKPFQFETIGELYSIWTDGKGYFIAAGGNGMIYTKDGYSAEWVYSKAPTDINFVKVSGISKTEEYFLGQQSLASGNHYAQVWRYKNSSWTKLMDNQDTSNTAIKIPEAGEQVYDIAAFYCSISDSLYLYIVGGQSFEFISKGNSLTFNKYNLSAFGLPISYFNLAAARITVFSPKDYWISSLEYFLYHWNGSNFKKIEPIPSLPYGQLWGGIVRIRKNSSGKIWIILETDSQVFTVIQGTL